MAATCACCGRLLPGVPEPSDPEVELWDQRCVELRSAGARYARELEGQGLAEWVDARRAHPDSAIEVRAQ